MLPCRTAFSSFFRDCDHAGGDISAEKIARFLNEHNELSGLFITNSMAHRAAEAVIQRRKKESKFRWMCILRKIPQKQLNFYYFF